MDRRLPWTDIAHNFAEPDDDVGAVSARLRKRFERIKQRLHKELSSP